MGRAFPVLMSSLSLQMWTLLLLCAHKLSTKDLLMTSLESNVVGVSKSNPLTRSLYAWEKHVTSDLLSRAFRPHILSSFEATPLVVVFPPALAGGLLKNIHMLSDHSNCCAGCVEFGPDVTASDKSVKVMLNSQDKVRLVLVCGRLHFANCRDSNRKVCLMFRRCSVKSEMSISPTSLVFSVRKPGICRLHMT